MTPGQPSFRYLPMESVEGRGCRVPSEEGLSVLGPRGLGSWWEDISLNSWGKQRSRASRALILNTKGPGSQQAPRCLLWNSTSLSHMW